MHGVSHNKVLKHFKVKPKDIRAEWNENFILASYKPFSFFHIVLSTTTLVSRVHVITQLNFPELTFYQNVET